MRGGSHALAGGGNRGRAEFSTAHSGGRVTAVAPRSRQDVRSFAEALPPIMISDRRDRARDHTGVVSTEGVCAMSQTVSDDDGAGLAEPPEQGKPRLVHPGMGLLFVVLIGCFTAWGIAADLTTPMVAGFKAIFEMSTFQASLVQLAYFGAYFLLALPAAFINERFGYKVGLLTGLGLGALGAFLFYPASKIMTYEAFLVALFALAAGCSILETSANPYVIALGPEETSTRR